MQISDIDTDDRLRNWARCYRDTIHFGSCGSVEGRYRSNWRQWVTLGEIELRPSMDSLDAEIVEQAWRRLIYKYRIILKLCYMTNLPAFIVARKAKVKTWKLEEEYGKAIRAMQISLQAIDNQKNFCYDAPKPETCLEQRDSRP